MKKLIATLMSLILCTAITGASAEAAFSMSDLNGMPFTFMSGVGGWHTFLTFGEDGAFTGEFVDGELGETGEENPNGTVYTCRFSGRMSVAGQVNGYTWRLNLDELVIADEADAIVDGVLYKVYDSVYGLANAQELLLYLPGTPVSELPYEFLFWAHLDETDNADTLTTHGIFNVTEELGFVADSLD